MDYIPRLRGIEIDVGEYHGLGEMTFPNKVLDEVTEEMRDVTQSSPEEDQVLFTFEGGDDERVNFHREMWCVAI